MMVLQALAVSQWRLDGQIVELPTMAVGGWRSGIIGHIVKLSTGVGGKGREQ